MSVCALLCSLVCVCVFDHISEQLKRVVQPVIGHFNSSMKVRGELHSNYKKHTRDTAGMHDCNMLVLFPLSGMKVVNGLVLLGAFMWEKQSQEMIQVK